MEDEEAGEILKFLLDTNILSEIRKPKPHGGVLAWFTAHHSEGFAIPSLALFELQVGAEKVREQDPQRATAFDFWVGRIAGGGNILPLDATSAREAARLLHKRPPTLMIDAMIAATAKVHGLIVATRNMKDFEQFEVEVTDPFRYR